LVTDMMSEERQGTTRDGEKVSAVDIYAQEMLTSIKDVVPYLFKPWRGRVAVDDGYTGLSGDPCAYSQEAGVAIADAVTASICRSREAGSPVWIMQTPQATRERVRRFLCST
ncbi:MAG TPA: hypothetical protein VHM69_14985, partial [Rubrobacter sp.]|nr:hypothetical protein [Rubrobacter sp.]